MVPIREYLCPTSKYSIKCSYTMTPGFIVIHNTANKASAINEVKYMLGNNNYVSYHFAVDDKEAVQALPLTRNGWHTGDGDIGRGNRRGIGIEICYSWHEDEATWKREYKSKFEKAQENAAELTAYLLHEYGWGMDPSRIKKHEDFSGKHCPHRTLDDYGWTYFINLVKAKYKAMYEEKEESMTAAEKKEFDALKAEIKALKTNHKTYDTVDSCPEYARDSVKRLIDNGYLKGNDNGKLALTNDMIRLIVILDRSGAFGK